MTYEKLYEQYLPMIKGFSYKYKVNGYDREDIEQELAMVLHKCYQKFDAGKGTKFITYLQSSFFYHIAKLRKKHFNDYHYLIDNIMSIKDENAKDIYDEIGLNQILSALENVKYGDYIKMYYLYGQSLSKIAKIEKISKQAVHEFINKGIENLKKILDV